MATAVAGAERNPLADAAAVRVKGSNDAYPNIKAYVDKVHARPTDQRGLERGGPYELMG